MAYLLVGNRFLKNTAWSRISNLFMPMGDDKNLERNGGITDLRDLREKSTNIQKPKEILGR